MVGWNTEHIPNALIVPWLSGQLIASLGNRRVADVAPEGAREVTQKPYVDYFARLNAMTAQLEPAAEIHWW